MKKIEAYRCEHCGKLYLRPFACKRHETSLCLQNPVLRPLCYSCKHYQQWIEDVSEAPRDRIEVWHGGYDDWCEVKTFTPNRCDANPEIKLFHNHRIKDDTYTALLETGEYVPMPLPAEGCGSYEPRKR